MLVQASVILPAFGYAGRMLSLLAWSTVFEAAAVRPELVPLEGLPVLGMVPKWMERRGFRLQATGFRRVQEGGR